MNLPRKKDRLATLDWGSDPKLCKCRSVKDDSGRCRWQPPSRRWRWSNTIQRQHVASLHYYILTLKAGVVCILLVKLCDPHLSALEVRFSDEALYKSTFTFTYYISFWDLGRRDQTVVFQRGLGRRKVGCLGDFVPRRSKLRLYTGTIILTQFFYSLKNVYIKIFILNLTVKVCNCTKMLIVVIFCLLVIKCAK